MPSAWLAAAQAVPWLGTGWWLDGQMQSYLKQSSSKSPPSVFQSKEEKEEKPCLRATPTEENQCNFNSFLIVLIQTRPPARVSPQHSHGLVALSEVSICEYLVFPGKLTPTGSKQMSYLFYYSCTPDWHFPEFLQLFTMNTELIYASRKTSGWWGHADSPGPLAPGPSVRFPRPLCPPGLIPRMNTKEPVYTQAAGDVRVPRAEPVFPKSLAVITVSTSWRPEIAKGSHTLSPHPTIPKQS